MRRAWHIVTGEYPPDSGGVADYTAAVAGALADTGVEVHVWASGDEPDAVALPGGVVVHRVAGPFGPAGLVRLDCGLDRFPGLRTILIQYVPARELPVTSGIKPVRLDSLLVVGGERRLVRVAARILNIFNIHSYLQC